MSAYTELKNIVNILRDWKIKYGVTDLTVHDYTWGVIANAYKLNNDDESYSDDNEVLKAYFHSTDGFNAVIKNTLDKENE